MTTREEWLTQAVERLNEMIGEKTDLKPSKSVLVSAGWPRRDRGGKVIGQCWKQGVGGGKHHVFISPMLHKATDVLPALLHELIHAADDCQSQHKGAFRTAWKALGFVGKPTECTPGSDLRAELRALAGDLGAYPHKRLYPGEGVAKQTTRMLKVACEDCGCIIRMTQKWLDEVGAPTSASGTRMEEAA